MSTEAQVVPIQAGRLRLHPKQMRFFLAKDPVVVAMATIRGGKTHVGAAKSIFHWLENPTEVDEFHVVGSPTFPMSRAPQEKLFRLLFDKSIFPICPLIRYRKGDRIFELACAGGRMARAKVVTMSDPDKNRGFRWRSAWLDEPSYMDAYAWEVAQGRLLDSSGPAWLTTTPNGYNWIFDLYQRARLGDPRVRFVHWNAQEAPHLKAEDVKALASSYDERTASQELGALFVRSSGRVYYTFGNEHVVPGRLNPALPLIVGMDFNVSPMSLILLHPFKTREGLEGLHAIGEHYIENGDTYQAAQWIVDYAKANKVDRSKVLVYPDASGRARHTSGGSDFQILRDAGLAYDAPPVNGPVRDRVNCVNGLFRPMIARYPRLLVDPSLVVLIEALEKQQRDAKGDPDKSKGHDHPVDALGYPCVRRYPLRMSTHLAA